MSVLGQALIRLFLLLKGMKLHWWPMVRDCIAYLLSVVALIAVIADEQIQW